MTLASLTILLAGAGIFMTGYLALIFLRDPQKAMVQVTHRVEYLPKIMAGRYFAFFLLTIGATLSRDPQVIGVLFAVFAIVSFYDTWIYQRDGHPFWPHFAAGVASSLVAVVALLAQGAA